MSIRTFKVYDLLQDRELAINLISEHDVKTLEKNGLQVIRQDEIKQIVQDKMKLIKILQDIKPDICLV